MRRHARLAAAAAAAAAMQARGGDPDDVSVVRQRAVVIDLAPIGGTRGALPPARLIALPLFDDVDLVAVLQRTEAGRHGTTWIGTIEGVAYSPAAARARAWMSWCVAILMGDTRCGGAGNVWDALMRPAGP